MSSLATRLASYLSRLSPIPAFPEYTGPHKVGTIDVEVPFSAWELQSPVPVPEGANDIHTVMFRMFYPAVPESGEKRTGWLPTPQRQYLSAYAKFLGIGPILAKILSFLFRHIYYTAIPVHNNATLHEHSNKSHRWPTMIFSHGLGGCRNSYSYVAGSLASHGVVVLCPEHRDGSAITTFIRHPRLDTSRLQIPFEKISHEMNPEDYLAREAQLRIRCWELGLIHQALLAIDRGSQSTNLNCSDASLDQFIRKLNVHEPGSVIFAGHSFGAATVTQFLKSTYYASEPKAAMENPLFAPFEDSEIRQQITEKTITMLLDMWCMPLMAVNSAPLFNLPLPAYADICTAADGKAILAVESEFFYNWTEHLQIKARVLSPDPMARRVTSDLYELPSGKKLLKPNFFYVMDSAHLSHSDFGVLFPWLTKKIFKADRPERALRLNLRAQLQLLRDNGVPIARTHVKELVDGTQEGLCINGTNDDQAIFDRSGKLVNHWRWIDLVGLGDAGE